jgi:hypothetical protein
MSRSVFLSYPRDELLDGLAADVSQIFLVWERLHIVRMAREGDLARLTCRWVACP